jgi:hypothetical protein
MSDSEPGVICPRNGKGYPLGQMKQVLIMDYAAVRFQYLVVECCNCGSQHWLPPNVLVNLAKQHNAKVVKLQGFPPPHIEWLTQLQCSVATRFGDQLQTMSTAQINAALFEP